MKKTVKTQKITFRVDLGRYNQLIAKANKDGIPVSFIVRSLVYNYLNTLERITAPNEKKK